MVTPPSFSGLTSDSWPSHDRDVMARATEGETQPVEGDQAPGAQEDAMAMLPLGMVIRQAPSLTATVTPPLFTSLTSYSWPSHDRDVTARATFNPSKVTKRRAPKRTPRPCSRSAR